MVAFGSPRVSKAAKAKKARRTCAEKFEGRQKRAHFGRPTRRQNAGPHSFAKELCPALRWCDTHGRAR